MLLIPTGDRESQSLRVVQKREKVTTEGLVDCRFVPLVGKQAWPEGTE